jgi:GNAT superfamily N-acetyltransferase
MDSANPMFSENSVFDVRTAIEPARLPQLMRLYAGEWWTSDRSDDDVAGMLRGSDLVFAAIHRPTDQLVGFARVLTDDTYLAVILDVIVSADHRKRGLGAQLLDAVVGHPRLARVRSLELACQPDLVPFYRKFGFTDRVGRSLLMRRTSDPRLAGRPADGALDGDGAAEG